MLNQLQGLHIELTNMCTLKCPRCARTKFIETFPKQWTNKKLDLDNLKRFLDISLDGKIISLCGNYGDPIYYDQLFDVVDFLKEQNATIKIYTNGSYQKKEWWEELVSKLSNTDSIVFAIDGLPHNFTQYRINADWQSITQGISVVAASPVKMVWQYLIFSYNESSIAEANKLADQMGFDEFIVTTSDRFDSEDDWLRPSLESTGLRDIPMSFWKSGESKNLEVSPKCKELNNQHYISADGYYLPCCFAGDHRFYYKSEFYKNRNMYNISTTTISQILQSNNIIDFYSTLEDAKLNYCTFNCPKL